MNPTSDKIILQAQQRVEQKWYEFVQMEQQGAAQAVLERKFHAYMLAVEELNRCSLPPQIVPETSCKHPRKAS